jgi:hypothetical protein
MNAPDQYRTTARELRNLAKKPGPLVRRVKLIILAEQFEELAHELDLEFAERLAS